MEYISREQIREQVNHLAAARIPFLFLVDYKAEKGAVIKLTELASNGIACAIDGVEIGRRVVADPHETDLRVEPILFDGYKKYFDRVMEHIHHGDSYLLNLTFASRLVNDLDMSSIYLNSRAGYKFMIEDEFLFYSPEPFLRIENDVVSCCPMKGTSKDEKALIESYKELCEHHTIVDLIRNDLSMISRDVEVEKFRYTEAITTANGKVFQTSSKISGKLDDSWRERLGDIILRVLPAGSISGAPKVRTMEIIEEVEPTKRGFYTGVMGVYDGMGMDSCVIIRYIEKCAQGDYYFRSGGGITAQSNAEEEYAELLAKIYVPII